MATLCEIVEVLDTFGPMDFEGEGAFPNYDDPSSGIIFAGLTYIAENICDKFYCKVSMEGGKQRVDIHWGKNPLPQADIDQLNAFYASLEQADELSDASPHLKAASLLRAEQGNIHVQNVPHNGYHVRTTIELPPRSQ